MAKPAEDQSLKIEASEVDRVPPEPTKAEAKDMLDPRVVQINPAQEDLLPSPAEAKKQNEEGAQTKLNNPPYSTNRPDVPIVSGVVISHAPDPAEVDAEGRPVNPPAGEK